MVDLVSLASAVVGAFNGTVSLGGMNLSGLEVPEKLNWGGQQRTVQHKLPGGARIIDLMGADDADIKWSGYFQGPLANSRARSIDAMRAAGRPVPLSWPGFTRTVIVSDFTCSSERGGWLLPYSVTCVVVPTPPRPGPTSLLGQLAGGVVNSLGLSSTIASIQQTMGPILQTAQTALGYVSQVLPIAGVLSGGSAVFGQVAGALGMAQQSITLGMGLTSASIDGIAAGSSITGTPLGTMSTTDAISNLQTASTNTGALATFTNMGATTDQSAAALASGAPASASDVAFISSLNQSTDPLPSTASQAALTAQINNVANSTGAPVPQTPDAFAEAAAGVQPTTPAALSQQQQDIQASKQAALTASINRVAAAQ